jgi:hypothetical protein
MIVCLSTFYRARVQDMEPTWHVEENERKWSTHKEIKIYVSNLLKIGHGENVFKKHLFITYNYNNCNCKRK